MSQSSQRGRTAEGQAGTRAAHRLYDAPVLFDDPWAIHLISSRERRVVANRLLFRVFRRRLHDLLRPIWAAAFACFRHTEKALEAALERGVDQYLILGAGLDSFALRRDDLAGKLRVFELDHPATQALKRERLARATPALPENLELVPIDFEIDTLAAALARSRFDAGRPVFVSWLNTVPYLTREAVFATLRSLRELAAPGSEIVFNFSASPAQLAEADVALVRDLARRTRNMGEPMRSQFVPADFVRELREAGIEVLEELGPEALAEHYLTPGERAFSMVYLVRASLASASA